MICLGVDPGKQSPAWALVERLGGRPTLLACGLGPLGPLDWNALPRPDCGVVEVPVAYPGSKVNTNDLITLALEAGRALGYMASRLRFIQGKGLGTVQEVKPADWKGQLPKPSKAGDAYIVARRIIDRCHGTGHVQALDLAPSLEHNVWDAIGIAMFGLGVSIK